MTWCNICTRPTGLVGIITKYIHWLIDWLIVFNATFSNISAISWQPVLVVEEAGGPAENHRPRASNWKNFITCGCESSALFSSPDPKGHVSYCHHLASVVRRKLFQKSSPLKVLKQWKPNLVWIITKVSSFKIVSGDAVHQPTWPLLLKIEHMVKLQVLGNNSKTVNNIKNLTGVKMISTSRSTYPAILK